MTFALIEPLDDVSDTGDLAAHHAELAAAVALRSQRDAAEQADQGKQVFNDSGAVICADCGLRINPKRLAARPQVRLCVHCQSQLDGTAISPEAN